MLMDCMSLNGKCGNGCLGLSRSAYIRHYPSCVDAGVGGNVVLLDSVRFDIASRLWWSLFVGNAQIIIFFLRFSSTLCAQS